LDEVDESAAGSLNSLVRATRACFPRAPASKQAHDVTGRSFRTPCIAAHASGTLVGVDFGSLSDETLILEVLLDVRDDTKRILAILEDDDGEEEVAEEDA
jgi:hypothetical protein